MISVQVIACMCEYIESYYMKEDGLKLWLMSITYNVRHKFVKNTLLAIIYHIAGMFGGENFWFSSV